MSEAFRAAVAALLPDQVRFDEPLARHVAFKIGGPADVWATPHSAPALAGLLALAREHQQPVTLLGTGSNVLVADRGVRGVVIRLRGELADVHLAPPDDGGFADAEVGAGALNAQIVALALRLGLVGIEFLGTIPGTFGGALIMNAGAHGSEIAPFVEEVRLIALDGQVVTRPREACGFVYRGSAFLPGEILTSARLRIPPGDASRAKAHLKEMREARRRTQPIGFPNAGSIFKNPRGDYAGRLIEAVGLKGQRCGGAEISSLHANFIINVGGAQASDVLALATEAQDRVRSRFGVSLEWEVRRVGEF